MPLARIPLKGNHNIMGMKPPLQIPKKRSNKSYKPLNWEGYFDELHYMDNVLIYLIRELQFI